MRTITLDPGRLADLEVFSQAELREVVADMLATTEELLDQLAAAVAEHDLPRVAQAAHRGRNEALSVGAHELDHAFAGLEAAAEDARSAWAELGAMAGHARRDPANGQLRSPYSSSPRRIAAATAAARSVTPSFSKMLLTCVLTVEELMNRRTPICGPESPSATNLKIWDSRSVSSG